MTQRTKTPFRHHCHFCQVLPAVPAKDIRPFRQLCQPHFDEATHRFAATIFDGLAAGLTANQIAIAIRAAAKETSC